MSLDPKTIYLKDYQPPAYQIAKIDLVFDLQEEKTLVSSTLQVLRNKEAKGSENSPLVLQGKKLLLLQY